MTQGVAGDESFAGDDVVIHQQHDLAGGLLDRRGARRVRAGMGLLEGHHPTVFRAEAGRELIGPVTGAVDGHDDLGRGRVREQSPRTRLEPGYPLIGRYHDRDGGEPGSRDDATSWLHGSQMIDQTGMTAGRRRRGRACTRRGRSRAPLAFVAWGAVAGRSVEIAESLGGHAYVLFPPIDDRRPPPAVRYAVGSLLTLAYLVREDPGAVVTTNPPVLLGLIALAWARLRGIPFALDSHPGAFGKLGDRVSARLLPVHRYLVRHADVTLVTAESWVEIVQAWGGRGLVVHEAPGPWGSLKRSPREVRNRPRALLVSRFGRDEPVDAAVAAAALIPEIDLLVTGRLENLAPELAESASPNVSFVGFLPAARYQMLVAEADLVVALTTEPTSVMRSAYEAVYARRPLVISDWPLCRELFPFAVAVANDPASIAEGLRRAVDNLRALEDQAENARRLQAARWESQLAALVSVLGLPRPDTA